MSSTPIPNNLGPTLLLVLALLLLPLGIGLPLLLLSLAQVRTWQGQPALPRLHRGLERLRSLWSLWRRPTWGALATRGSGERPLRLQE